MDYSALHIISFMAVLSCWSLKCGGQSCANEVNAQQRGTSIINMNEIQVIVPMSDFSCSGRITGYLISLQFADGEDQPTIQVYRQTRLRTIYNEIDSYTLRDSDITNVGDYYLANVSFTGNDRIEFQPGYILGYFIPEETLYYVWNIEAAGFTSYIDDSGNPQNNFAINTETDSTVEDRQPLIQVIFDIRCDDLSSPPNGDISSCTSGSDGVGYEGDTCSFTCNTGYELTGSDTRTCQSDGSWSGSDDVCRRVQCRIPDGVATTACSPDNNGVPSYDDICTFTCDIGYEKTGNATRMTCQIDGSWSDSDDVCRRVTCPSLTDPENGTIACLLGNDRVLSYEDNCIFTCNTGYELTGSPQATCQSDGSWSGSPVSCTIMECPSSSLPMNSMLAESCSSTYQSMCDLQCEEGFNGGGNPSYVCDVLSDGSVMWMTSGGGWSCERGADGSNDERGSGSAGAAVGGVLGGLVFFAVIVMIVLLVMLFVRRQRRKNVDDSANSSSYISENKHACSDEERRLSSTITGTYKPPSQPEYEDPDSLITVVVDKALSSMSRTHAHGIAIPLPYEVPLSLSRSNVGHYEVGDPSAYEVAESTEVEQQIYETPCENEENVGPVYCKPPSDEKKIYEEFEGKRFRKVFHREIVILEKIGTGEFGVVNRGMWKPSSNKKEEVALKTLNTNSTAKDRVRFLQEAAIMCQFDHENVIKLYGVVTDQPAIIVLEYMSRGDLKNVLLSLQPSNGNSAHEKLPIVLLKFCQEIAAGMVYLSAKNFVHRDLAARNILLSESTTCKIADFGMSRNLLDENYYVTSGGKIPVKWTAPEAIYYKKYSPYSDVWSYGCVLYEIWSLGCNLYGEITNDETLTKLDSGYRLPPPPGCSRIIYRMMIKCWNPEPRSRPQFGQIKRLLASNWGNLLHWSYEDKQISGEDATKLGGPLGFGKDLYYDLQMTYRHNV